MNKKDQENTVFSESKLPKCPLTGSEDIFNDSINKDKTSHWDLEDVNRSMRKRGSGTKEQTMDTNVNTHTHTLYWFD
jgi:hypothetical protein